MRYILFFLLFSAVSLNAQVVYEPITSPVYEFIDEMANEGFIDISTLIKPYSRKSIAENLNSISDSLKGDQTLNKRQKGELQFYLKDFGKELNEGKEWGKRFDILYHNDENFTLSVNPILSLQTMYNDSGLFYHRRGGAEAFAYFGNNLGMYASLRDNGVNKVVAESDQITRMQGGNYKFTSNGGAEWSEMKGGIVGSWKWGEAGFVKDDFTWGNNYNGANIFSDRNPSFGYLTIKLYPTDWFEMNYIHGWLVSEQLDSANVLVTSTGVRKFMISKFVVANMFTFKPFDRIRISVGNSSIYDNKFNPIYLMPVMFYKSLDHTYNGAGSNEIGQNSQLFFDISVRRLKHFHFYATMFVDEISFSNLWDKDNHSNFFSMKGGFQMSNVLPNTFLTFEYTRTNPWAFRHDQATTTFASNQFTLGHHLLDNSDEIHVSLAFKPVPKLTASLSYTKARKGPEHIFQVIQGVPNVKGLNWMETVDWTHSAIKFSASYQIMNNASVNLGFTKNSITGNQNVSAGYFWGNQNLLSFGAHFGL
jgi:hypothetical protein